MRVQAKRAWYRQRSSGGAANQGRSLGQSEHDAVGVCKSQRAVTDQLEHLVEDEALRLKQL